MRSASVWMLPLAIGCAVFISACSGGGSAPPAISAAASSAPVAPAAAKKYTVTIALANVGTATSSSIRATKSRDYISPATGGVVVTATSTTTANQAANDGTFGFDLNAGNPNCVSNATSGSLDCSIAFALAADTYTISLTAYDQTEATLPVSAGTALANDTETITVSPNSAADVFSFTPKAYVAGFSTGGATKIRGGPGDRPVSRATVRRDALESASAGLRIGASGGFGTLIPEVFHALDRDGYLIDQYPGQASFENGTFYPIVTEFGDGSGCTSSAPCSHVINSVGTTYPAYATTTQPAAIAQATSAPESLTFAYSGGGSVGGGIKTWKSGAAPTGQIPYYADFSVPDPSGGTVSPYVVPHLYIVPLFAYATDGAGHQIATTSDTNSTVYVWAAQALTPGGTSPSGGNYYAYFDASHNATCVDAAGATVMSLGSPTFYAGYGDVFPISVTPDDDATCTLDTFDGAGDMAQAVFSVPEAPIVIR